MTPSAGADRAQTFAAVFGLCLGVGGALLTAAPPQPLLGVVFWIAVAVLNARTAVLAWRRLGLRIFATCAMVAAAVLTTFAVLHARGVTLSDLTWRWWLPYIAAFVVGGTLSLIEHRRKRAVYDAWKEFMAEKTFLDFLLGKTVPDLRETGGVQKAGLRPV